MKFWNFYFFTPVRDKQLCQRAARKNVQKSNDGNYIVEGKGKVLSFLQGNHTSRTWKEKKERKEKVIGRTPAYFYSSPFPNKIQLAVLTFTFQGFCTREISWLIEWRKFLFWKWLESHFQSREVTHTKTIISGISRRHKKASEK